MRRLPVLVAVPD